MKIKAANNYVVIRLDAESGEEVTAGGIVVPEGARSEPDYTTGVITSGPDASGFDEGDRVLIAKYAGQNVTLGGEQFRLMLDRDVFGWLV